ASNSRQIANGGVASSPCANGGDDVSGGAGGGNFCPAAGDCTGCQCLDVNNCGCATCNFSTVTSRVGVNGQPGAGVPGGAGGTGAAGGIDLVYKPLIGFFDASVTDLCFIPGGNTYGSNGANGGTGLNGTGVAGCSATGGSVDVTGNWVGGAAPAGITAGNG